MLLLPESYGQDSPQNIKEALNKYLEFCNRAVDWYKEQSLIKRIFISIGLVLASILVIGIALFHAYLIKLLILLADNWADMKFGLVLLFTMLFFVGFPPLLGFSPLSMLAGMVYGVAGGWVLVASASITGSFGSFLVYRYLLRERSKKLLESNDTFKAFAETIKQDQSLLLLILIRLCPLPYSLSNGALSAIPELSPLTYVLASIITSPKLLIHIFVGHQLKDIGEEGNTTTRRVIDVVTIIITGLASGSTTYIIYNKMQRRLNKYRNADPYDENYNEMIFGNFEDDESGGNLELDSADFDPNNYDPDNFVIEEDGPESVKSANTVTTKTPLSDANEPLNKASPSSYTISPVKRKEVPVIELEEDANSLELGTKSYRDY